MDDEQVAVLSLFTFENKAQLERAFWADLEKDGIKKSDEGDACERGGAGAWAEWHLSAEGVVGGELACAGRPTASRAYVTDIDRRNLVRARSEGLTPSELAAWATTLVSEG